MQAQASLPPSIRFHVYVLFQMLTCLQPHWPLARGPKLQLQLQLPQAGIVEFVCSSTISGQCVSIYSADMHISSFCESYDFMISD